MELEKFMRQSNGRHFQIRHKSQRQRQFATFFKQTRPQVTSAGFAFQTHCTRWHGCPSWSWRRIFQKSSALVGHHNISHASQPAPVLAHFGMRIFICLLHPRRQHRGLYDTLTIVASHLKEVGHVRCQAYSS